MSQDRDRHGEMRSGGSSALGLAQMFFITDRRNASNTHGQHHLAADTTALLSHHFHPWKVFSYLGPSPVLLLTLSPLHMSYCMVLSAARW